MASKKKKQIFISEKGDTESSNWNLFFLKNSKNA